MPQSSSSNALVRPGRQVAIAMASDSEEPEPVTEPRGATLALRSHYHSETPLEVTTVAPPHLSDMARSVSATPRLEAPLAMKALPPPARTAPALSAPVQSVIAPIEGPALDDGVRDYLPTVRIRNRRAIQLWYRGPRMPVGAAVLCFCVALFAGIAIGGMLRVGTQIALEAHVAGAPSTVAQR